MNSDINVYLGREKAGIMRKRALLLRKGCSFEITRWLKLDRLQDKKKIGEWSCIGDEGNDIGGHPDPESVLSQQANSLTVDARKSTFVGRFKHFLDVIDPRTLFVSEKRLQECLDLLDRFNHGTLPTGVTNAQLWRAQKIKQAILHPDTGDKILMPFRMSGYIPFGTPVVIGLLLPNQNLLSSIFWQWLNQSHNACVNFCNRNATKPTPVSTFCLGYAGAVTSAVSIAVGLKILVQRADKFPPATRTLLQRFIPFPAVAAANVCNVLLMRHSELSEGISVLDDSGKAVGTSRLAARHALLDTALTRVVLPMPILLLPPIIMAMLERLPLLQKHRRLVLPIHSVVVLGAFSLALPLAISLFPQMSQIDVSRLEPDIAMATDCKSVTYNKGL